ncbi:hypothetical protein EQV77_13605 [Halobacillus fulvus]|nr:hypothetical protein EQV77_13605 [Halobacillus fulvus]
MYLTEVKTSDIIGKQFRYKFKSYIGVFSSLVIIQLLGLLFSLSGSRFSSSSAVGYQVDVQYYTVDIVMIFTIFWGFMSAMLLTTKAYREDDFAFITNRFSSNLSTIAFLAVISLIGSLTAVLSGFLLKVVVYLVESEPLLSLNRGGIASTYSLEILGAFVVVFLFATLGYAAGMIIQLHRLFIVVLPAIFLGGSVWVATFDVPIDLFHFYFQEANFLLFLLKMVGTAGVLCAVAMLIANRLEVKR